MNEHLKTLTLLLTAYAPKVVASVAIFFVGRWASAWLTALVVRLLEANRIEATLVKFLRQILFYALLIIVILASLNQLGIDTSSLLTVIGAAGLAIGLALKDSLSNFSAGTMLVVFRPFKIGDFITAAGVSGVVREISIFNTELATPDNLKIIVPNSSIMSGIITNASAHATRRVDITVGIGYHDDLTTAKTLLTELLANQPLVLRDPAPAVVTTDLGASSVNLACRAWVNSEHYWEVRATLLEKIKASLEQAGISIPFPQQDVRLFVEKGGVKVPQ